MDSLAVFFDQQTRLHGSRTAVRYRPRYRTIRWSYDELREHVLGLTQALSAHGVESGDRVVLCAENSPYWVAAFFAILARGGVVVPLNPKSTPDQINRISKSAEPKLALLSSSLVWPNEAVPFLPVDSAYPIDEAAAIRDRTIFEKPGELAEIIYTSGTTGDPKGVMLSHRNLLADLDAVAKAVPLTPDDHVLTLLPLFHVFGQMTSLLCSLHSGCSVTYLAAPTTRAIREALTHTPATHLVVVPEVLKTMMDRLESRLGRMPGFLRRVLRDRIRSRISGTLRTIVCGGAPLDPTLEEKWWNLGFEVLQGYGLTETSPVISTNTSAAHRTGSVGKPLDGVEVRLAQDSEILVRGPIVMHGYYRDAQRTEAVLANGWLKTEDAGRFDEDGFLYVFGRKKYMILGPSGENVFPEDLEAELNRVPGVIDSAVVGLPKDGRTIIHAALLCEPNQAAGIVAETNRHLAPHQQIMSWSVWPEPDFPRSVTRKVKKEEVIKKLGSQPASQAPQGGRITPLKRLLAEVTQTDIGAVGDSTQIVSDLNLDSLLRIELVSRIEDELGVYVEEVQITPELTVADLEALVQSQKGQMPKLGRYPRWSNSAWASRLRPLAQQILFRWWLPAFCRLRVDGEEHLANLPEPVIFMANHRSFLDPVIATWVIPAAVRSRLGIAAGTEVLYGEYGWFAPLAELTFNSFPFPTRADENIRPGLDYTGRMLDDGWNVLIFPEGQLNRSERPLLSLKGGTGVVAVEMGVPVVPLVIQGSEKILPPGAILPKRRSQVTVRFGQPLRLAGEGYADATARIESHLRHLLGDWEGSE
ncbi:AMP-binding protein [Methylocaldum sp.]|uniref:AMP-binding protein n=1 Tax=Methylocaldum sp. TaxID=1969727 RepID=UPI002D293B59|nr:AMP-binding protein [Methylocaldum sp.]HYE34075.1 AMP-binding protein [Methylocaldum sp.]